MGQRTDVKSPAILPPAAVCSEPPWSPAVRNQLSWEGSAWPEVRADGWAHARAAGSPGLRLPWAPVFSAPSVTLFLFPHIPPPSPSPSPPKLNLHNKCGLFFQVPQPWLFKYTLLTAPIRVVHAAMGGGSSKKGEATSRTAVGRGRCLSWSSHAAPQERTLQPP